MSTKKFILTESVGRNSRFIKFLSSSDYQVLNDAQQRIWKFRYFSWRIKEIELNYDSLINSIERYDGLSRTKGLELSQLELCSIDINRLLINLIASFKFFMDYLDAHFKKLGETSLEYQNFKKFTNHCYETYFSYKLFYNLRNYSQHKSFPLFYFYEERDYRINERELKIGFSKSNLLRDRDINKKMGGNLNSYNEYFPVKPLLIQVLEPLNQLKIEIYRIYENEIVSIVTTINSYKIYLTKEGSLLDFGTAGHDQAMIKMTSKLIELSLAAEIDEKLKYYKMRNFT